MHTALLCVFFALKDRSGLNYYLYAVANPVRGMDGKFSYSKFESLLESTRKLLGRLQITEYPIYYLVFTKFCTDAVLVVESNLQPHLFGHMAATSSRARLRWFRGYRQTVQQNVRQYLGLFLLVYSRFSVVYK